MEIPQNNEGSELEPRGREELGALKLEATKVQLSSELTPTPEGIIRRYRENRNWTLHPKEWIYRNLPIRGDVLDFGCGTGEITTQLAILGARKVYALDVTPGLLEITRKRARLDGVEDRVELMCGFLQDLEPRPVDLVIAYAVLHHCHPIENVLPHLLKWLRPGGTFVCVEPVVYFSQLERLREASGVPFEPLDEGERKLDRKDVDYICGLLAEPKREHFRLLARADRWLPEEPLIRIDRLLLQVPFVSNFAGTVLIHGKREL